MKNANGYGTVKKLSGKRRNPYAVLITTGYKIVDLLLICSLPSKKTV